MLCISTSELVLRTMFTGWNQFFGVKKRLRVSPKCWQAPLLCMFSWYFVVHSFLFFPFVMKKDEKTCFSTRKKNWPANGMQSNGSLVEIHNIHSFLWLALKIDPFNLTTYKAEELSKITILTGSHIGLSSAGKAVHDLMHLIYVYFCRILKFILYNITHPF